MRDIAQRETGEWRPWHLPRLSADPWRGPDPPLRLPVFRPVEPRLRPLRVGMPYRLFGTLTQSTDGRVLRRLPTQPSIRAFVIPVGDEPPPPGFDRCLYAGQTLQVVENWALYEARDVNGQTRWFVRSAAGNQPIEERLAVDDPVFRQCAGVPVDGPFALPTAEHECSGRRSRRSSQRRFSATST